MNKIMIIALGIIVFYSLNNYTNNAYTNNTNEKNLIKKKFLKKRVEKKKFIIRYFLNLETKEFRNPYQYKNYPKAQISIEDSHFVKTYYKVYYEYASGMMYKAKYYYKDEHHTTFFFDEYSRLIRKKNYISYYKKWNSLLNKPFAESLIKPTRLNFQNEYFKVYYFYKDKLAYISKAELYKDDSLFRSWNYRYNGKNKVEFEYHTINKNINDKNKIKYLYNKQSKNYKNEISDVNNKIINTQTIK